MSEKIDPQTPCTREFTTRRVLMSAGFPAILTRQHCGPSPLYTTTHLVPCPSSAQILVGTSYLNQTAGCLDRRKKGGTSHAKMQATASPPRAECSAPGPISTPAHPKLLFLIFISYQPLTLGSFLALFSPPPLPPHSTFLPCPTLRTHSLLCLSRNMKCTYSGRT